MRTLVTAVVLGLAISVAQASEPRVIEITLDSYTITPNTINVKANEPVTFRVHNAATFIPHNLVIHAPDAGIDIKIDAKAGKTATASFTPIQAGTYEMYCDKKPPIGKNHRDKGMHGKLIVE